MSKEVITPEVVVAPEDLPQEQQEVSLPALNVNVSHEQSKRTELSLAQAENIGKFCEEIMDDIRKDREQHGYAVQVFLDMVINDGDASNSSKEAVTTLMKNLSDLSDKKIKVMDLLMRAFLKESNTFPKYLAAHQHNQIHIEGGKRAMIQSFKQEAKNDK